MCRDRLDISIALFKARASGKFAIVSTLICLLILGTPISLRVLEHPESVSRCRLVVVALAPAQALDEQGDDEDVQTDALRRGSFGRAMVQPYRHTHVPAAAVGVVGRVRGRRDRVAELAGGGEPGAERVGPIGDRFLR